MFVSLSMDRSRVRLFAQLESFLSCVLSGVGRGMPLLAEGGREGEGEGEMGGGCPRGGVKERIQNLWHGRCGGRREDF